MELGRKYGPGLVQHTLVAAVVEVDKVLLEVAGESASVNGITVVLAGNVALSCSQVEGRNVMGSVAILEFDSTSTNGKGQELVAKTDAHDGDGRSLHQTGQVIDSLLAVSWVAGTVGDEDTIVVLGNLVDGVIIREDGNRGTTADQASENILLDTTINKSNVERGTGRLDHEGSLGAHTLDEVDLARIDEALVFVGVVFFANGNSSKRGSLFSEESDNLTSIDARNGRDTLTGAPLAQTLDSSPMAVVESYIRNDNASTLNVGGLKMLEKVVLVSLVGGHSVVANERLGKNQNLATVRRVSHGLRVADQRGGEDSFTRDVGIGTKSRAIEDRAILSKSAIIPQ